ncbi:hypothetical protein [Nitrincola nitratireducens]|nr:hypothetical protein [Nitrincola nitratireducens]
MDEWSDEGLNKGDKRIIDEQPVRLSADRLDITQVPASMLVCVTV